MFYPQRFKEFFPRFSPSLTGLCSLLASGIHPLAIFALMTASCAPSLNIRSWQKQQSKSRQNPLPEILHTIRPVCHR